MNSGLDATLVFQSLIIFDWVGIPAIICDKDHVVQEINPAAVALLGIERHLLHGYPLHHFDGLIPLSDLLKESPRAEPIVLNLFDTLYCQIRVRKFGEEASLIILEDVTERRLQETLQADAINMIVHDLKAPISAIKSYAELVINTGELNSRQKQFLQRIQQAVRGITILVNDLLDMAWIDSNMPLDMHKINVASLVNMTVEMLQERANSRGIYLNAQFSATLPMVMGDSNKLERVFINLITNAIKFSPEGKAIQISVIDAGKNVTIAVADNGIGIAPEHLSHIFERFYRIPQEGNHKDTEGSGLGLAIVKAMVERHGGRVEVKSELGKGSTFMVVLPAIKN